MNIFLLDYDMKKNAEYYMDSHVVKQVLEHTQMLMTAYYYSDKHKDKIEEMQSNELYKVAHPNHPCTIWTRTSIENWDYLYELTNIIDEERRFRNNNNHLHASICKLNNIIKLYGKPELPSIGLTRFACTTADDCRSKDDVIENYRDYYNKHKQHLARWKNRQQPEWFTKIDIKDEIVKVNIDNKLYIKLKLIYKLVHEGSIQGERDAAANQLAKLLIKHNIEYDEIIDQLRDEEPKSIRGFRVYSELEKILLVQIICLRLDVKSIQRCNKSGSKWFTCELTDREFLLIKDEYDHYKKHLNDNLNDFVLAFLMKNGLVGTTTEEEANDKVLTPEQSAKAFKMGSMLQGMDYVPKNQVKLTETSSIN